MPSKIRKRPVDVEFENLSYKIGKKKILNSVSGKFSSGQLTAILGSSGAGKSSLLNVLAGLKHKGVDGTVLVNGKPRQMKTFRKISRFLMQEDLLRTFISVREAVNGVAQLKLGENISSDEKTAAVEEVIALLGLGTCSDTRVENLSGGQRKRLSIALEMIDDPPVFFLDEPTTGLDDVVAKKFVQLLKSLASHGRTIVCVIHQPSDSMFQLFDQVYFMSDGCCTYSGDIHGIVPFLAGVNLPCPPTYAPSDYIIELVHHNDENTSLLVAAADNGRKTEPLGSGKKPSDSDRGNCSAVTFPDENGLRGFPTSFCQQFRTLSGLMFARMARNRVMLVVQCVSHVFSAVCTGVVFQNIGNDGDRLIENMFFFYASVVYNMFMHMMPQLLLFPSEVKLLQREYFNRWYSLKAYYAALSFTTIPPTIVPALVYSVVAYWLTDQPMETGRFCGFVLMSVLAALVSQAYGHVIGSLFNAKSGAVFGSAIGIVMMLLGMYNMGYTNLIHPHMKFIMSLSYSRHVFAGYALATLKARELLDCSQIYCHLSDTRIGLRIFGLEDDKYYMEVVYLMLFLFANKLVTYLLLHFRVKGYAYL